MTTQMPESVSHTSVSQFLTSASILPDFAEATWNRLLSCFWYGEQALSVPRQQREAVKAELQ